MCLCLDLLDVCVCSIIVIIFVVFLSKEKLCEDIKFFKQMNLIASSNSQFFSLLTDRGAFLFQFIMANIMNLIESYALERRGCE